MNGNWTHNVVHVRHDGLKMLRIKILYFCYSTVLPHLLPGHRRGQAPGASISTSRGGILCTNCCSLLRTCSILGVLRLQRSSGCLFCLPLCIRLPRILPSSLNKSKEISLSSPNIKMNINYIYLTKPNKLI